MSCICLDTNWFLKGLESPCPPDWTALSALFSENSDAFSLPRFPMQVHDVLLAYGIIENPNIRGVNRDLWIHERDWVYCCRFSAQANVPSLLTFDGVDTFADVWLNGTLLGSCSDVYLSWEYDVGHASKTSMRRMHRCFRMLKSSSVCRSSSFPTCSFAIFPALNMLISAGHRKKWAFG